MLSYYTIKLFANYLIIRASNYCKAVLEYKNIKANITLNYG